MKAIIPVAGSGTRLRPLTNSKPKALLRVGSKPIIAHIIERLLSIGCREMIPIISPGGGQIPLFIEEYYPEVLVQPVIQQHQLGLGHAVNLAAGIARGSELIVVYGDTIIQGDMSSLIDHSFDGVIAVKKVEDPRRFGVVHTAKGLITKFVEKPAESESNLAVVGLNYIRNSDDLFSCLDEIIENDIRTMGEYQITDAFQLMVGRGKKMKPFPVEGWFDAGTPETLLDTNRAMLITEANCESLPGSIIKPPVFLPESAVVSGSVIGPNVSVGNDAIIEQSIISDSIIGDGAKVVNARLFQSLIGDHAEVICQPGKLMLGDHSSIDFEP